MIGVKEILIYAFIACVFLVLHFKGKSDVDNRMKKYVLWCTSRNSAELFDVFCTIHDGREMVKHYEDDAKSKLEELKDKYRNDEFTSISWEVMMKNFKSDLKDKLINDRFDSSKGECEKKEPSEFFLQMFCEYMYRRGKPVTAVSIVSENFDMVNHPEHQKMYYDVCRMVEDVQSAVFPEYTNPWR